MLIVYFNLHSLGFFFSFLVIQYIVNQRIAIVIVERQAAGEGYCLSYLPTVVLKYCDKIGVKREKMYLAYSSRVMQSIMAGKTQQQVQKAWQQK